MKRTYQLTFPGLMFSGITAFVFLAAINSQANLLFFAFGLMLAAVFVSAIFSTLMLGKIDVIREIPDHAEVRQHVQMRYRLTSRGRWWPAFAIHVTEHAPKAFFFTAPHGYCLHLSPLQTISVPASMVPSQRGEMRLDLIRLACAFPFGLVRRNVHVSQPAAVVVYPRVGILDREIALRCRNDSAGGTNPSQSRGGNDEFFGLREYRAGDNIKAIHWRRTARTGQVVVRELTHASPPRMLVVVDVRAWREVPDGLAAANRALELAATLICHAILENHAVGLCLPGALADLSDPGTGRDTRDRLLRAIATLDLADSTTDTATPRARGAEWILITLRSADAAPGFIPASTRITRLAMDHPDAAKWIHFAEASG